ncbi:MAG: hypothetical protein GY796_26765 [Chloroflexi bacterium]|nr:hypothetical protein [Chloroflexota bacterium]
MVHALKQIRQMLAPNGCLIDMHPIGKPAPITVRIGEERHLAGWIREESEYEQYLLADEALQTAVAHNWYQQKADETFAFITYFDSLPDLEQYLAEEWKAAYIESLVSMQIESLMRSPILDQEIIIKEIVRIACFTPNFWLTT